MIPTINVATMDIPRGLLGRCIPSFLNAFEDRDDFSLRWACRLDRVEKLDALWDAECQDIEEVSQSFDECCIEYEAMPGGFGPGVAWILGHLASADTLWILDDWDWTGKRFRLGDVMDKCGDAHSFVTPRTLAGTMSPVFYRQKVLDYLREQMPADLDAFTELTSFRILKNHFRLTGERLLNVDGNHIGHARMVELGFSHNFCGLRIDLPGRVRGRPVWDATSRKFVQKER